MERKETKVRTRNFGVQADTLKPEGARAVRGKTRSFGVQVGRCRLFDPPSDEEEEEIPVPSGRSTRGRGQAAINEVASREASTSPVKPSSGMSMIQK